MDLNISGILYAICLIYAFRIKFPQLPKQIKMLTQNNGILLEIWQNSNFKRCEKDLCSFERLYISHIILTSTTRVFMYFNSCLIIIRMAFHMLTNHHVPKWISLFFSHHIMLTHNLMYTREILTASPTFV